MDTLRGIPEHVEADFGDSIVARDEALVALGVQAGLGPPDLCWLQKCQKRSILGAAPEAQGYYHFVLGRDVSSTAAVAAYFALLNSKVEPLTMLQGLWLTSECTIQRGFYCCYDAVSRMDLRCELCIPGGVLAGCVDAAGVLHDVTPQHWMQAQVCSFVRAVLYDAEMRLNGGSVICYDPCPTAAAEASLLSSVLSLYSAGHLPGGLEELYAEQGCGVLPEHMDLVLAALWQHFRRRQRWNAAADFFRQLSEVYQPAALLLGVAHSMLPGAGLLTDLQLGRNLHQQHAEQQQSCPAMLVGLAQQLLEAGQATEASDLARQALQLQPRCRPAWMLLAACFIAQSQYAAALVTLNVVPTPPLPAAEVELLHVKPPPPPKSTTQPQARLYDGELESVRWQALEEASLDGSRLLAYLPGSILVNREPLGSGFVPDISPNRITRSVLAAVYILLQDIVSHTSWDAFLEIRSSVFLMQHEATPRPSQEAAMHQQQHQQQQVAQEQPSVGPLQQKLEQLGIQPPQQQQQDGGANGLGPAAAAAAPGAATVGPSSGSSAAAATPPASRGRLSSSGGTGHKGSPKSYYASKLHDELAKPHTPLLPSGVGGASLVHQQQQQQQQQQERQGHATVTPEPAAVEAPHSASAVSSSVSSAEAAQRSMAGRVLLLGKKQERRTSSNTGGGTAGPLGGGSVRSSSSGGGGGAAGGGTGGGAGVFGMGGLSVGCGVPRTLAPNEVEDLSKLATASVVTKIRTQHSVTPELWDIVFGASRSPTSAASRRTVQQQQQQPQHHQQHWQLQQQDDSLSSALTGLPRIRTRPLAEAVEGPAAASASQCILHLSSTSTSSNNGRKQLESSCVRAVGSATVSCVQLQQHRCSHERRGISPGVAISRRNSDSSTNLGHRLRASSTAAALHDIEQQHQYQQRQQQRRPQRHRRRLLSSCFRSSAAMDHTAAAASAGPLAEGLDRTTSLLLRTSSVASSVGTGPFGAGGLHSTTGSANLSGPLQHAGGSSSFGAAVAAALGQQHQGASSSGSAGAGGGSSSLLAAGSGNFGASLARRASLAGEAASATLEADREALIQGWIWNDSSVGTAGAATSTAGAAGGAEGGVGVVGRRLCVRWLDELIVALWHDLQAYMEWKVWDQSLREARGGTHAELVLGLVSGTPLSRLSDGGSLNPPILTASDWMRRGALAERLGHVSDARAAYRAAVKLQFNLTCYLALLRLEAQAGSISDTHLCAAQILAWHQQRLGQSGGGGKGSSGSGSGNSGDAGVVVMGVPPEILGWAMGLLADGSSLEEVRKSAPGGTPAAVLRLLDEWQRWQQVQWSGPAQQRQRQQQQQLLSSAQM